MDKYYSKFLFKKDKNNKNISAIYPLQEVINDNLKYKESLGGGSIENENYKGSRFQGLGVPIGLYSSPIFPVITDESKLFNGGKKQYNNLEKDYDVIDENKFNELFDNIRSKSGNLRFP
jgi:hypothetical protein